MPVQPPTSSVLFQCDDLAARPPGPSTEAAFGVVTCGVAGAA
jgi:hypothetical protein